MVDVSVRGAEQLVKLSKELRAVGEKDLAKELRAALREAATPVKAAIREHAERTMPHRGGLNRVVARSRITTQVRGSGRNPGVRIASKTLNPRLDQSGRLRHPVYGNRNVWVTQHVEPGWFTVPASHAAPEVRDELVKAIGRIQRRLEKR